MDKRTLLQKSETPLQVDNAIIQLGDIDDSGKGKRFKSRFIQAGIAGYPGTFGNVLVKKETLDKYINSMVGVPVIINHKDITVDNADELRVGVVSDVYFNEKDGWYWCNGVIWNETAQDLIKEKGWSVSCSYDALECNDEGGSENNIKYDREFTKMNFTHLALVSNPRYERANIVFNSKMEENIQDNITDNSLENSLEELITTYEPTKADLPILRGLVEVLNGLGESVNNGGVGSGDFEHAGRPGLVGGSEPAGTGRNGKYENESAKTQQKEEQKEDTQSKSDDVSKSDIEADLKKEGKTLKKVDVEQPKEVNKKQGDIEIKKETKKAYLLNKEGVNFWVQKRWYKDGKLTPAGQKSFEEAKDMLEYEESKKNKTVGFKHSWESEKAYGVDFAFNNLGTGHLYNVRVFIPKSQVKDGKIPYWLYEKKLEEAYEKAGANAYKGDYGSGFDVDNSKEPLYAIIEGELYEIIDEKQEAKVENALEVLLSKFNPQKSDLPLLKGLARIFNEKWITIHPHGKDSEDYRRLKIEDGETVKDAIDRVYKKEEIKENKYNEHNAKTIDEAIATTEKFVNKGGYKLKNISLDKLNKLNTVMQKMSEKYGFDKLENIKTVNGTRFFAQANDETLDLTKDFQNMDKESCEKYLKRNVINWENETKYWLERYKTDLENNRFTKIAKKEIKRLQEDLKYKRNQAFSGNVSSFFEDIVTHEFGHIISHQKMYKDREKAGKIKLGFNDTIEHYKLTLDTTETANLMKDTYFKAKKNGDIYNISKYASKNYDEFFAECFLMYNNNEKLPDYIKNMVTEIIKK